MFGEGGKLFAFTLHLGISHSPLSRFSRIACDAAFEFRFLLFRYAANAFFSRCFHFSKKSFRKTFRFQVIIEFDPLSLSLFDHSTFFAPKNDIRMTHAVGSDD